jgi:haloalkane dehalogenase
VGGFGQTHRISLTASNQTGDLDAVITQLHLRQVTLVAHDASGPPAIDWALDNAPRVAGLVLLNTYYCAMPTLRSPEAIWVFSTPVVRNVRTTCVRDVRSCDLPAHVSVAGWEIFRDAEVRDQFLPLLYQQFDATPGARPAFFRLNEDLLPTIRSRTKKVSKLREFRRRVRIIFGDADPYLNKGVARRFHELFPGSELFLVPGPRHFLQMDEPAEVARLILAGRSRE